VSLHECECEDSDLPRRPLIGWAALRVRVRVRVRSHHGLPLELEWRTRWEAEAAVLVLGAAAADVEAEAGSLASQDWREGSQEESAPVPCSQQTIHSHDWRRERFRCSCGGASCWDGGRSCWSCSWKRRSSVVLPSSGGGGGGGGEGRAGGVAAGSAATESRSRRQAEQKPVKGGCAGCLAHLDTSPLMAAGGRQFETEISGEVVVVVVVGIRFGQV
jgi:ribosomal protein L11 methylase PrmA